MIYMVLCCIVTGHNTVIMRHTIWFMRNCNKWFALALRMDEYFIVRSSIPSSNIFKRSCELLVWTYHFTTVWSINHSNSQLKVKWKGMYIIVYSEQHGCKEMNIKKHNREWTIQWQNTVLYLRMVRNAQYDTTTTVAHVYGKFCEW